MATTEYSREEVDEYLSKSRIKQWVNCPRSYYYKYVEEIDTPETEAMIRGSAVHEIIEYYYKNAVEYGKSNDTIPDVLYDLLDLSIREDCDKYIDPYITHFLGFERRRWENSGRNIEDWLPIAIEEEKWLNLFDDDRPISMGYADIILPAASFCNSDVPENEGYVMLDFKTGDDKSSYLRKVENGGVELDLTYYKMLFETDYDIVSVAAYYPKTDTLATTRVTEDQRDFIDRITREMNEANPDNINDYPLKQTPLCAWGDKPGERCNFYDRCDSTWAVPIDNKEKTIELIEENLSNGMTGDQEKEAKRKIATELGTTVDALEYWINNRSWYRYK